MLALEDPLHELPDRERVRVERPGCDLPVQYLGRYVRVVGRHLPPALRAGVEPDAHDPDKRLGEGFDAVNFHGQMIPPRGLFCLSVISAVVGPCASAGAAASRLPG